MESKELGRLVDIFKENRKRSGCNIFATIATVVDLVREETKSVQPIAKEVENLIEEVKNLTRAVESLAQQTKNNRTENSKAFEDDTPKREAHSGASHPIDVFLPKDRVIYEALYSLGCEDLSELSGCREERDPSLGILAYQVCVKGRFATLPPLVIGREQIDKIILTMAKYNLPFPIERPIHYPPIR